MALEVEWALCCQGQEEGVALHCLALEARLAQEEARAPVSYQAQVAAPAQPIQEQEACSLHLEATGCFLARAEEEALLLPEELVPRSCYQIVSSLAEAEACSRQLVPVAGAG